MGFVLGQQLRKLISPCILTRWRFATYCKTSIKPPGAYLISETSEGGGLDREGAYWRGSLLTKSDDKDINNSFSILLPSIMPILNTILLVKYINPTHFYPKPYQNLRKVWGAGLFKVLAQRGQGLIREGSYNIVNLEEKYGLIQR